MQISDHRYFEKVFKKPLKKLKLAEEVPVICIEALKTTVLIWRSCMLTLMKAAIHLGPNCIENLEVYRNTNFEKIQNLFGITQKLVWDHHDEILNVTTIEWTAPPLVRCTFSHDQVIKWTKAKARVYSDSLLCLGKCQIIQKQIEDGENQVEEFRPSCLYRELFGIDGEPIEFELNIFPGLTSLEILQKIHKHLQGGNMEPEDFEDRIFFMSMSKAIEWTGTINPEQCV